MVLNPWNLEALQEIEQETGKKIYTILQLRLHPAIIELKEKVNREIANGKVYDVDLYIEWDNNSHSEKTQVPSPKSQEPRPPLNSRLDFGALILEFGT